MDTYPAFQQEFNIAVLVVNQVMADPGANAMFGPVLRPVGECFERDTESQRLGDSLGFHRRPCYVSRCAHSNIGNWFYSITAHIVEQRNNIRGLLDEEGQRRQSSLVKFLEKKSMHWRLCHV